MSGEANQIYKEINYRFKHVIYRNYHSIRCTSQYLFFTIINGKLLGHQVEKHHVKYMTKFKTENVCIGINKNFLKLSHWKRLEANNSHLWYKLNLVSFDLSKYVKHFQRASGFRGDFQEFFVKRCPIYIFSSHIQNYKFHK